ncbi:MAG: PorV/PorQ family protein [Chitinispirillia bacterium]|nr:PorV/PorQ family protein [Chitinispirillia bacterium]MCL2242027.1 PorV/PorQ family protein [Chitinispirillia bacterium]
MRKAGNLNHNVSTANSAAELVRGLLRRVFRPSLIIVAALLSAAPAQHNDAGTTAFPFVNINYDARSTAMGGASAAIQNGIYGVLSNPAAAGYTERNQLLAGYRQTIMDIWGGPLGIALVTTHGVVTPYLLMHTSGSFEEIGLDNLPTGHSAKSNYTALGVSFARTVFDNRTAVGAAVKALYHYIGVGSESYSADGFALDLGVQYRTPDNRLTCGAALRNLGFVRSGYWNEWNEYELPYGFEAGVSFVPKHIKNLRIAVDVNKYNGDFMNIEPAFEYTIIAKTLFLRGGYGFSSVDFQEALKVFRGERDDGYQKSGINTFSLGLGVAGEMDNVDLALDAAVQFYSDTYTPGVVVSLVVGF